MLTPAERTLRARAAAYALHAQGGTSTHAGTAAFLSRFERQVDPDGTLVPEERARRATFARKSYMARLGLRAAKARRLGDPSDREVARIAELERLLMAAEGRDDVAAPVEADDVGAASAAPGPNIPMNKMDPAAVAMPAGSVPDGHHDRSHPAP